MTRRAIQILSYFVADPMRETHAMELRRALGVPQSTVSVALRRYEQAGWLTGRWGDPAAHPAETIRHRYYRITAVGAEQVRYVRRGDLRMSPSVHLILEQFLRSPAQELYGRKIRLDTGLDADTVYTTLLRLETAGWLVSRQEKVAFGAKGSPKRRRYYRLTKDGDKRARGAFAEEIGRHASSANDNERNAGHD